MVSVTPTARNIESTAESLQEDLARLEIQKQALERELAAVTAHLGSVQRALDALQALMPGAGPATTPPSAVAPPSPAKPKPRPARATASAAPAEKPPAKAGRSNEGGDDAGKTYGRLTEQILAYFAKAGDAEVRARDVASALGRDTDSGSINAIRSTLDRLVGASRVQRVGRGLYRAVKP